MGRGKGFQDQIVKALFKDEEGLWLGYYESSIDQLNDSLKVAQSRKAPDLTLICLCVRVKLPGGFLRRATLNSFAVVAGNRWFWILQRIRYAPGAGSRRAYVGGDKGLFMVDLWYEQYSAPEAVTAIAAAGDTMWYSRGGDLYYIDINTGESKSVWQGDNPVLNIYVDDFGRVWSGTFDDGLKIWDTRVGNLSWIKEVNGLVNNNVLSVDGNKEGIWVGTLGGVSHFSLDEKGNYDKPENHEKAGGKRLQYIYSVHVSDAGEVYLATDGDGVMRWGGLLFEPLSEQVVLDVTTDQQGKVWWITPDGKLYWWTQDRRQ
ncbi:MAG: hypothetical protein U5L96_04320 [Owenweeksia sp.]|nr:hypothetical protein [Owenweeksia sp.]